MNDILLEKEKSRNYLMKISDKLPLFEITTLLCICANVIHTHTCIMGIPKWYYVINPTSHICFLLFDGLLFYFISYIIPKYRKKILLITYFLGTILLWVNVAYSRYFNTYLPPSLYNEFNNLKGLLPNIIDSFEYNDLFFIITSILTVCTFCIDNKNVNYKKFLYLPILVFTFFSISCFHHYLNLKERKDHFIEHFKDINDKRTTWDFILDRRQAMVHTDQKVCTYYYGISFNLILTIFENIFKKEHFYFTPEETALIKNHLHQKPYPLLIKKNNNIILILVESLSSYPIGLSIAGKELTPNINKLLPESYFNPHMKSEALLGESSDGQFIYLTGLLPLKNSVTINEISTSQILSFVSLAKKQKKIKQSQMIIPTENDAWSQIAMCGKYGIDSLHSQESYNKEHKDNWLNDRQLFDYASDISHSFKTPFISIILTSSTHSPYIKSYENTTIEYPSSFSKELKNYLNNIHYADKYLGRYIKRISTFSWFKDCTIIITADHKPNAPKLNTSDNSIFEEIPLIIFHPPYEYKNIKDNKTISQTAVFPTILDILNIKSSWRGVGQSIFIPDSISNCPYEIERKKLNQRISEYIMNVNYLK